MRTFTTQSTIPILLAQEICDLSIEEVKCAALLWGLLFHLAWRKKSSRRHDRSGTVDASHEQADAERKTISA